jgi:hypothetical protein
VLSAISSPKQRSSEQRVQFNFDVGSEFFDFLILGVERLDDGRMQCQLKQPGIQKEVERNGFAVGGGGIA